MNFLPRLAKVQGDNVDYLLFATNDYISNTIIREGSWENHLQTITQFFTAGEENPIVLDIGANLGGYSLPLAKKIHAQGGKVYAFEPQRIIYYQLCANTIINRLNNLYAYNYAVGDNNETIKIPECDFNKNNNIGAFSIKKEFRELHGIEESYEKIYNDVNCVTLDSVDFEGDVSFIKIDVEGFEINVLKGATNFLLKNGLPPFIFEAWNFEWFEKEKKELLEFITTMGYEVFQFDATNYLAQHPAHKKFYGIQRKENGEITFHRKK